MGKPLSIDLRERVLAFVESGHSRRAAARRYHVSASFVMKLMARARVAGTIEPARQGRPPGQGKLTPYAGFLGTQVDAEPDITMPELAEALFEAHDVRVTPAALSRFLIREGFSYKKTLIETERGRAKVRRERDVWVCLLKIPSAAETMAFRTGTGYRPRHVLDPLSSPPFSTPRQLPSARSAPA